MSERLLVGSRASRLALAQTEWVAGLLRATWPGLEIVLEKVRTAGDRQRRSPLASLPGVGFFVKELEAALLDGRIDLAVHSMKDVPTHLAEGLEVEASVPRRADPRDCLVTRGGKAAAEQVSRRTGEQEKRQRPLPPVRHGSDGCPARLRSPDHLLSCSALEALPRGARIGTSSPRRRAMLLAARPDLEFVDLRGSVETRLAKVEGGACDATVLARAGLERLGLFDDRIRTLETEVLVPAAGQGALGLEFRAGDERVCRLVAALDDRQARQAVTAERAVVRRLGAGCRTPLGVLGRVDEPGRLSLEAYLLSADGRVALRRSVSGPAADAAGLGERLAERLLGEGAARLIAAKDGSDA